MTNFEQTYLINKHSNGIQIITKSDTPKESGAKAINKLLAQNREDIRMQLQYRELDRLSREFEEELKQLKELRKSLEKYKFDFSIQIKDEATKQIKEVFKNIQNINI